MKREKVSSLAFFISRYIGVATKQPYRHYGITSTANTIVSNFDATIVIHLQPLPFGNNNIHHRYNCLYIYNITSNIRNCSPYIPYFDVQTTILRGGKCRSFGSQTAYLR